MILILTDNCDPTVDLVRPHLARLGAPHYVVDLSAHPFQTDIAFHVHRGTSSVVITDGSRVIRGEDVTAVWYRWPGQLRFAEGGAISTDVMRAYIRDTALSVVSSLEGSLAHAFWLYKLGAGRQAYARAENLRCAVELGFRAPETVITSSPAVARDFIRRFDFIAVKQAGPAGIKFNDDTSPRRYTVDLFTRRVSQASALELAERLPNCPFVLQEYVEKRFEVRATVVGDHVHACSLASQDSAHPEVRVDFRTRTASGQLPDVRVEPYQLPAAVEERCVALVRRLGLHYGAIDFIVTPGEELVFLELTPNGQWGGFAERSGLPIAECVAQTLASAGRPHPHHPHHARAA